uniref:QWRF motif-containing protein 4 n=1 Tax=Macrostomum lignano TaxID=282301 RepID=A0A1I8JPN8_9PLAT
SSLKCNAVSFSAASAAARQPAAAAALVSPPSSPSARRPSTLRSVSKKLNRARSSRTESTRVFNPGVKQLRSDERLDERRPAPVLEEAVRCFGESSARLATLSTWPEAPVTLRWDCWMWTHSERPQNVKQPLPKRKLLPVAQLSVVDPSPSMMQVGSAKASAKGSTFASSIQWLEGRAESLPLTRPLAICTPSLSECGTAQICLAYCERLIEF